MKPLLQVIGVITGSLSILYLILVINTIQVLSVLTYPISPRLCRFINRACAKNIWGLWVVLGEGMLGIKIRMVGEAPPVKQNALVLANHRALTDVLALLSLAWRCGRLGDLKWFVKDQLKWVPGVGWGMRFIDCIFVRRNWQEDKAGIESLFGKFKKNDIAMWLISFLEGTRFSETKRDAAQAFAQSRDLYVPTHTLVPRVKGFVTSVEGLREHVDAVYVVTIAYPKAGPSLTKWFSLRIPTVDLHVSVYPINELPTDEHLLGQWAYERYRDIDERLMTFYKEGSIAGPEISKPIRSWQLLRPESMRRHFHD